MKPRHSQNITITNPEIIAARALADERKAIKDEESITQKQIHCCGCNEKVAARLTDGGETYPHRPDLAKLHFWKCDKCGNFVGCHHKSNNPTDPLGCIPTPELKKARQAIHRILDPIWQTGKMKRKEVYAYLTDKIGWKYHTANIRYLHEATEIIRLLKDIKP